MPLATLNLLQLHSSPSELLSALKTDSSKIHVILASIPQLHVIRPEKLDTAALNSSWDLLVLATATDKNAPPPDLTKSYAKHIKNAYTLRVGIPSRLVTTYPSRNADLLSSVQKINSSLKFSLEDAEKGAKSSSQNLELSPELLAFTRDFTRKYGPNQQVTMLNLLHFEPEGGKKGYAAYGQAFVDVASKRGGNAKLVGNVVPSGSDGGQDSRGGRAESEWWNEFSLVHYPSVLAFCDMLSGEDYQDINRKHRLGALKDTVLICTKEIDGESQKAKL